MRRGSKNVAYRNKARPRVLTKASPNPVDGCFAAMIIRSHRADDPLVGVIIPGRGLLRLALHAGRDIVRFTGVSGGLAARRATRSCTGSN